MKAKSHKRLRIMHMNANGITSVQQGYLEWETLLQSMDNSQVDIFCLNETNVDTKQSEVRFQLRDLAKRQDIHTHLKFNSSKQSSRTNKSIFKPGGTLVGIRGNWSGRAQIKKKDKYADKLNRWTVTHLNGKKQTTISIISVYQVCQVNSCQNGRDTNTAYLQQQHDLFNEKKRVLDPRDQLCKDLESTVHQMIESKHKVIVCADINDDAGYEFKNQWNRMMNTLGMRHAIQSYHGNRPLPRTYDRGRRCLDGIYISENISDSTISNAGILPFYSITASDHRALYLDLDPVELFDNTHSDPSKHSYKGFNTKNVKKCDIYLKNLTDLFSEAKIFQKVREVKKKISVFLKNLETDGGYIGNESTPGLKAERRHLISHIQTLDTKRTQLMLAAEKRCGARKNKGMFWYSKKLQEAAEILSDEKKWLRYLYNMDAPKEDIAFAKKRRDDAIWYLRHVQQNDREYRDEMLSDLAAKRAKPWNVTHQTAVKILKNAEKSSEVFKKIRATVKKDERGGVRNILIPSPDNPDAIIDEKNDDNNGNWTEERDPEEIFELILNQNATMLTRSRNGIMATGPLEQAVGHDTENEDFNTKLLQGKLSVTQYAQSYPTYQEEAEEFLRQLQHDPKSSKMEWKFGVDEYKELFSRTKEDTSCGPSGLHMSHWKAALQRDEIIEVHSTLIWAAFSLGYSYERWTMSFHSMLKKKEKPYINKLRIIQIFEGDMNGALKYLFGRKLMRKMVNDGILDENTYGSIPGKDSLEAMKVLQELYDNHRILKNDLVVVFNDAAGCYDRIRANQAELCSRRVGCSVDVTKTHTNIQNKMVHKIKTSAGISTGQIRWKHTDSEDAFITKRTNTGTVREGNIGGVGQGGGASPVEWLVLLLVMLNTFHTFAKGASIQDPQLLYHCAVAIISYVDDNSIVHTADSKKSSQEIFQIVGREMLHWKKILRITGGDLAVSKCTVSLMKWEWSSTTGIPRMMSKKSAPGTICINDITEGSHETVSLRRLEPYESEKQLGIIMPLDGNFRQEYERRLQQSSNLGKLLYRSPLNTFESTVVYRMYYIPKINFPLSLTQFTKKQCEEIQKQFYKYALPKMGINRNTPRALIFGPSQLGGLEFNDLYCEQLHQHISRLTQHIRRNDFAGKAFLCNMNAFSILIGSSFPLFEISPYKYGYAMQTSTVYYLWTITYHWKIRISLNTEQCNPQRFQGEVHTIMDDAVNDTELRYNSSKLNAINECRLYHGLIYPSEMYQYTGKFIKCAYLYGEHSQRNQQQRHWPTQPKPIDSHWTEWRAFIRRQYVKNGLEATNPTNPSLRIKTLPNKTIFNQLNDIYYTTTRGNEFRQYILHLPDTCQQFTQFVACQGDEHSLLQALTDGELHIGTDGTHTPDTMEGAGAAIATKYDNCDNTIQIGAQCASEHGMTSLTAEQYGLISGFLIIHLMILKYGRQLCSGKVYFWVDNAEVLRRIQSSPCDDIRLKSYYVRDYSYMTLMRDLRDAIPSSIKVHFRKIKSHQISSITSTTSHEVNLNHLADLLAAHINSIPGPRQLYSCSQKDGIVVKDDNGAKIHDISSWIYRKIRGEDTQQYLSKRNNWDIQTINTIEWSGLQHYLRGKPLHQRLTTFQLIHNWQNVGKQKQMFALSKEKPSTNHTDDTRRLRQELITNTGLCPFQCGCQETNMHYMECRSPTAIKMQNQLIRTFKKQLQHLQCHEAIISFMVVGLRWTPVSTTPTYYQVNPDSPLDCLITQAADEQTDIGWNNVRRGFISSSWTKIQQHYCTTTKRAQLDWGKIIIQHLLNTSQEMWTFRNQTLHGSNSTKIKTQRHIDLVKLVDHWYQRQAALDNPNADDIKKVFRLKQQAQRKKGVATLEAWLKLAQAVVEEAEAHTSMKLDQWLQRENNYQD